MIDDGDEGREKHLSALQLTITIACQLAKAKGKSLFPFVSVQGRSKDEHGGHSSCTKRICPSSPIKQILRRKHVFTPESRKISNLLPSANLSYYTFLI